MFWSPKSFKRVVFRLPPKPACRRLVKLHTAAVHCNLVCKPHWHFKSPIIHQLQLQLQLTFVTTKTCFVFWSDSSHIDIFYYLLLLLLHYFSFFIMLYLNSCFLNIISLYLLSILRRIRQCTIVKVQKKKLCLEQW